ncbi:MAG: FitA-like ribbon-helix-helix domain-containing protein [Acidobacteriota bacterium]
MANLQVKNIPDSLYRRLKRHVRKHNLTLSEFVLRSVERELERSTFHERLASRPRTKLGSSAASLLEEERRGRDRELR